MKYKFILFLLGYLTAQAWHSVVSEPWMQPEGSEFWGF